MKYTTNDITCTERTTLRYVDFVDKAIPIHVKYTCLYHKLYKTHMTSIF